MGTSPEPRAHGTCLRTSRSQPITPICPPTSRPRAPHVPPPHSIPAAPALFSTIWTWQPLCGVSLRPRWMRICPHTRACTRGRTRTSLECQCSACRRRTTNRPICARRQRTRGGARRAQRPRRPSYPRRDAVRRAPALETAPDGPHTCELARFLVRGEERQHRTATRRPGPPFYSGADMRAPLYERLSPPCATSPGALSSRRLTRPRRRRQSRPRRSASLSKTAALCMLVSLDLDGYFCTALRRALSRSRLATGFSGRCPRSRTWASPRSLLHGRPTSRLHRMAWSSAQSRSVVSTVDAWWGGEKEQPGDSFRLRGLSCVLSIISSHPTLTLCYIREVHPPFFVALHLSHSFSALRSQNAPLRRKPTRGRASAAQPHSSALIRLRAAVLSWLEWMRARGALGPGGDVEAGPDASAGAGTACARAPPSTTQRRARPAAAAAVAGARPPHMRRWTGPCFRRRRRRGNRTRAIRLSRGRRRTRRRGRAGLFRRLDLRRRAVGSAGAYALWYERCASGSAELRVLLVPRRTRSTCEHEYRDQGEKETRLAVPSSTLRPRAWPKGVRPLL
jgi:hypothetical protein